MSNKQLRAELQTALLNLANRSAMSYEDLRNYLLHLKDKPGTDARIDWNAIRPQFDVLVG